MYYKFLIKSSWNNKVVIKNDMVCIQFMKSVQQVGDLKLLILHNKLAIKLILTVKHNIKNIKPKIFRCIKYIIYYHFLIPKYQ